MTSEKYNRRSYFPSGSGIRYAKLPNRKLRKYNWSGAQRTILLGTPISLSPNCQWFISPPTEYRSPLHSTPKRSTDLSVEEPARIRTGRGIPLLGPGLRSCSAGTGAGVTVAWRGALNKIMRAASARRTEMPIQTMGERLFDRFGGMGGMSTGGDSGAGVACSKSGSYLPAGIMIRTTWSAPSFS